MKTKLYIYTNYNINNFLRTALFDYDLIFRKLDLIDYKFQNTQANIILIKNNKDIDAINFDIFGDNFLIICNFQTINLELNKNIKLLSGPLDLNQIKNEIENFIQNLKINFHDICIVNEKLTNLNNKFYCYLTKVELEILCFLIREKETTKNYIKENILNIKSNIETNSLESHLTRIRKKMNKIKTSVKIQTRNEKLLITH